MRFLEMSASWIWCLIFIRFVLPTLWLLFMCCVVLRCCMYGRWKRVVDWDGFSKTGEEAGYSLHASTETKGVDHRKHSLGLFLTHPPHHYRSTPSSTKSS